MRQSDGPDESKMNRMMILLETLGNRLGNIETQRSGAPRTRRTHSNGEGIAGTSNHGQGLTMSALDTKPMQHREAGIGEALTMTRNINVLDGLNRDIYKGYQASLHPFDGKETYAGLEAPFTN